ncbi:protein STRICTOSIDINE SYNTHASE-LIKE 5 [Jatropha curcas]|uniref:protein STRICTOSIDINE SYNTHASE-LIKE 5 n=1 Tax=Jatropha curcas TaxID=180498 RepID=UPI001893C7A5|nr:protein STRICTOSIDINE SYNTHASE-LIKE 5 [Jatropha curcas]
MPANTTSHSWPFYFIIFSILAPVLLAIFIFQLDSFDPAPMPIHELTDPPPEASMKIGRLLQGSEFLGVGQLKAPEDIAYDSESGVIYTTCADGWIKRVAVNDSVSDSVVENWVNTGGRPLGLVLGKDNDVIVADAYKGLLKISRDGEIELLTDEAEGLKFKLTDGVDIAEDGIIYFTDASYKYNFHDHLWDVLEGKPHGRVLSYNPATRITKVLVSDLYFANGLAISPDQDSLIFCETSMRRCRKYYIKGNKKGSLEKFTDLPGMPDNIHYDGHGHFWIALPMEITTFWKAVFKYPFVRKLAGIVLKHKGNIGDTGKNGGVFVVDLEGKLISHYYDPELKLISSSVKIGNHLYCGSITYPYIIRLNLAKYPALANT